MFLSKRERPTGGKKWTWTRQFACPRPSSTSDEGGSVVPNSRLITAADELKVRVYEGPTECDEADEVKVGDQLGMHYTGMIDESSKTGEPGTQFDSSRDRGIFEVTIGVGELIDGWDKGIIGLCKGAKAILVIPPEMGYGSGGAGDVIPGGATLKFDVEVVSVSEPPPQPNLFEVLDVDQDGMLTPAEIVVHFQQEDPNAEIPPDLMTNEDTNEDGVISWEEFGGPRMSWPMCLEMLYHNPKPTVLGLAVRWLCQRPREHPSPKGSAEGEL